MTEHSISPISKSGLHLSRFMPFLRLQHIGFVLQADGEGALQRVFRPGTIDWGFAEKAHLLAHLARALKSGGALFGAYKGGALVGFCALEADEKAAEQGALLLSALHVSAPQRGCGIGRALFLAAAKAASVRGFSRLVLSSLAAEETLAFYRALGCQSARLPLPHIMQGREDEFLLEFLLAK